MKHEKDETIGIENHAIEEIEVEKYSDMGDEKTTAVLGVTSNYKQSGNGDEAEEIGGTDGNKIEDNSYHDTNTSLVAVADTGNKNADAFCLNFTMTNDKESSFEPLAPDYTNDNEMHVAESIQTVSVTRSDTTEEHDLETIIHAEEHKEEGMMMEATDNSVTNIRMFRNARETLVSISLKCFFFLIKKIKQLGIIKYIFFCYKTGSVSRQDEPILAL